MAFETSTTVAVYTNAGYHYEARAADGAVSLNYLEGDKSEKQLCFASLDEMEAVAMAMLSAVKAHSTNKT